MGLALITILLSDFLPTTFIDRWYYQGLFEWIRVAYDMILGWSPIPMIYVVVAIVFVRIFFWIRERKKGFLFLLSKAVGGIAFLIFLFYFLWGFNYRQVSLQARLGLDLKKVTQDDIEAEFLRATKERNERLRDSGEGASRPTMVGVVRWASGHQRAERRGAALRVHRGPGRLARCAGQGA